MGFFLNFISCVWRIALKQFQNDSGSLKIRKIKGGGECYMDLPSRALIKKKYCYILVYINY